MGGVCIYIIHIDGLFNPGVKIIKIKEFLEKSYGNIKTIKNGIKIAFHSNDTALELTKNN